MKPTNTQKIKYPRTLHLPFSEGAVKEEKNLETTEMFHGKQIVVTEKLDGENTTMYTDCIHARSLDGDHPTRHWVKGLQARVGWQIPEGFRICGENVYAKHSIEYSELDSYFYAFSVWNQDICLNYFDGIAFCEELGIFTAPVLYVGLWDEVKVRACYTGVSKIGGVQEGYVVRLADEFKFEDFQTSVAKFVRKNHVQTNKHWAQQVYTVNKLK
jgi:hypothetical protein